MPSYGAPRIQSSVFLGRAVIASLFVLNLCLLIYFNVWRVGGVPVRSLLTGGLFVACFLFYWRETYVSLIRYRLVHLFLLVTTLIALSISYINRNPPEMIAGQIIEVQLQAFMNFTIAAVMVQVFGMRFVGFTIIGIVTISTIVALFQYLGVGAAWDIRLAMGDFMGEYEESESLEYLMNAGRAMGLSLNPVVYATELCLVFIIFWSIRHVETNGAIFDRIDIPVVIAIILFLTASLVTGNRSPILGMILFLALYAVLLNRLTLFFIAAAAVAGLAVLPFVLEILESTGLRIFSTEDKSAAGRAPLRALGYYLFMDRPIGYGLAFDPREHWERHWSALSDFENASIVTRERLHNYFWNIMNKYGVLIVFPAAFAFFHIFRNWRSTFPFIVYAGHILFHNTGPLQGNALLWFVIPLLPIIVYETVTVTAEGPDAKPEAVPA